VVNNIIRKATAFRTSATQAAGNKPDGELLNLLFGSVRIGREWLAVHASCGAMLDVGLLFHYRIAHNPLGEDAMNRSRPAVPALVIVFLFVSTLRSDAESPDSPDKKPNMSEQPQLKERPAPPGSSEQPSSATSPPPAPLNHSIFGLTATQLLILAAAAVLFIFTAILMRWWLSEPADDDEAETPPAHNPQDAPQ
jgi:hypothetical protein